MGKKTVTCWFCEREVRIGLTRKFPNGARVCLMHECSECGDFIRPVDAVLLVDDSGSITHLCAKHRSAIIEYRDTEGCSVKTYEEAGDELFDRMLSRS